MVKPALATITSIGFMNTWNELFMAFMLISDDNIRPLYLIFSEQIENALTSI